MARKYLRWFFFATAVIQEMLIPISLWVFSWHVWLMLMTCLVHAQMTCSKVFVWSGRFFWCGLWDPSLCWTVVNLLFTSSFRVCYLLLKTSSAIVFGPLLPPIKTVTMADGFDFLIFWFAMVFFVFGFDVAINGVKKRMGFSTLGTWLDEVWCPEYSVALRGFWRKVAFKKKDEFWSWK